uniref:Bradykinin-potentiating peptide S n=1 Tax=Lycosa erythrognatha TaxID=332789 RepID=BPPS_LYCER|nr:RecName: Full=Bradykinin-potentiating peptide S; Short=BPP-S [Lycosa erythrognatha]
QAPWPDTISPP